MARIMGVGVVGCGVISQTYQRVAQEFDQFQIVACADLDPARAEAFAAVDSTGRTRALGLDELLVDPEVDVVLDLTVPLAHAEVGIAALQAGKALYSEKPLATTRADGRALLEVATEAGLRLGCAPDTFLGGGLQTCRYAIDEGLIGEPVGACALLARHGPEEWHPDPAFFYAPGAGPLFDLGPYYLTATVALLGPIRSVSGMARISSAQRLVRAGARKGEVLSVSTPTHVTGVLELASGIPVTLVSSFDVWASELPCFEIYGTEGTLSVPDPNTFGGPVRLWEESTRAWRELELVNGYSDQARGIGLADLVRTMTSPREPRASGALAYHVLDAMTALLEAGEHRCVIELASSAARPKPLPKGLARREID